MRHLLRLIWEVTQPLVVLALVCHAWMLNRGLNDALTALRAAHRRLDGIGPHRTEE